MKYMKIRNSLIINADQGVIENNLEAVSEIIKSEMSKKTLRKFKSKSVKLTISIVLFICYFIFSLTSLFWLKDIFGENMSILTTTLIIACPNFVFIVFMCIMEYKQVKLKPETHSSDMTRIYTKTWKLLGMDAYFKFEEFKYVAKKKAKKFTFNKKTFRDDPIDLNNLAHSALIFSDFNGNKFAYEIDSFDASSLGETNARKAGNIAVSIVSIIIAALTRTNTTNSRNDRVAPLKITWLNADYSPDLNFQIMKNSIFKKSQFESESIEFAKKFDVITKNNLDEVGMSKILSPKVIEYLSSIQFPSKFDRLSVKNQKITSVSEIVIDDLNFACGYMNSSLSKNKIVKKLATRIIAEINSINNLISYLRVFVK